MRLSRQQRRILSYTACFAAAILMVHGSRRTLFAEHTRIKEAHDVFFLPQPRQVATLSLGYKAALADVLWAYVLVSQGLHSRQQRRFDNLGRLYDTVNELAPRWRTPYLLVDALFSFQAGQSSDDDTLRARRILERGVRARPNDAELWLNLGQYVTYVAPATYLYDKPELRKQWRLEGARYLQRAAELGADANVAWQALGGAVVLEKAGELDAAVRFLERVYAVTDDDELKADVERRLRALRIRRDREVAKREHERQQKLDASLASNAAFQRRKKLFHRLMRHDLPYITTNGALLIGPPPQPGSCAGPDHHDAHCATNWRDWAERFETAVLAP
jgi:tetratricopeptide (TPR) repeat protein